MFEAGLLAYGSSSSVAPSQPHPASGINQPDCPLTVAGAAPDLYDLALCLRQNAPASLLPLPHIVRTWITRTQISQTWIDRTWAEPRSARTLAHAVVAVQRKGDPAGEFSAPLSGLSPAFLRPLGIPKRRENSTIWAYRACAVLERYAEFLLHFGI